MNTYNFTKFVRDNIVGDTRISITRASAIRFTTGFIKLNSFGDYKYTLLYYDSQNQAIGIQPTNKQQKEAFKITSEGKSGAASISVTSFLKANNIDPKKYNGRYEWHKESLKGIGELYIIDLKKNK
jgi:hypothetical protein